MFLNNSQNSQGNTFFGVTFLRMPCFTKHLQWLLLKVSGFQPATLSKRTLRQKCFSVNLAKFFRISFLLTEHLQMDVCFLCLSVNFEFFRTLLLYSTSGELLFDVHVEVFQPPDTVKNCFTGLFKRFIQEREVAI